MKKESVYDPRAEYNIPTKPFQGLDSQLEQHNNSTPEKKVKGQPLLSAGLGAAGVMTGLGGSEYFKGGDQYKNRVKSMIKSMIEKKVDPHEFKATSKAYAKFKPVDAKLTKNLMLSNIKKVKNFAKKFGNYDAIAGAGLKAVKNMSKGKLASGAAAGGVLGYLANQLISKKQAGE